MAIIYKVKQASKANKEGKKLYHPSTVHIGLVTTAQMAKEVAEYSSLTAGDVKKYHRQPHHRHAEAPGFL